MRQSHEGCLGLLGIKCLVDLFDIHLGELHTVHSHSVY